MQNSNKLRVKVAGVTLVALLAGAGSVSAVSGSVFGFAKHGADDPAGDIRGGHGADNAPGHARRGADDTHAEDPAGHGRRGADDTHAEDAVGHG